MALSCIRTIDAEHMPYLLRFLLLLATPTNTRRIISHIRHQLKLVGASNVWTTQQRKMKGKSVVNNAEASILDALRTSFRFNKVGFTISISLYLIISLSHLSVGINIYICSALYTW